MGQQDEIGEAHSSRAIEAAIALGVAGLLLTIGIAWGLPEPVGSGGRVHGSFGTLQRAAVDVSQRIDLIFLGWVAGLFEILVLVCALALGLKRAGRVASASRWLWLGGLLFAAVWSALVFSYHSYFAVGFTAAGAPLWGSLPIPTAIMLYGLWPVPLVFTVLYVWRFDSWVLSEADLERVREIREARQREDSA